MDINTKPTAPNSFDAVISLVSDAKFAIQGTNILTLDGPSGKQPTKSEIEAELAKLKTDYTNKKYQRDRSIVYDSIQEQLAQIYWDKKNGTNKWVEAIDKVKSDNPKP